MRNLKWLIGAVSVLLIGVGGYLYWHHATLYPGTDDAYVDAHVVQVAAQVSGPAAHVYVRDQQTVEAGQPLFDIDEAPFRLAVAQAQARLALARQAVGAQTAAVTEAQAGVADRRVLLENARINAERIHKLLAERYVTLQADDNARAAVKSAAAQLVLAEAKLRQARMDLGAAGPRNERIREATAALGQAELDLQHTHVAAACGGRIAKLSMRPGDMIQAGTPLFALVCNQEYWVDANFKETDLERIRAGQPAEITVDMYPGHEFHGQVEGIGPATGVAFSLLPPENATGNWVKVTQRVPVRVRVLDPDTSFPLRVGASAHVVVDTTADDKPSISTGTGTGARPSPASR